MRTILCLLVPFALGGCSLAGLMFGVGTDENGARHTTIGATFRQGKEGK